MTATATPVAPPIPEPVADFMYWDGEKTVHADRLAAYRKILLLTRGKPNELANKVFQCKPDETELNKLMESCEAAEQLALIVRDVFHMVPFDPNTGLGAQDAHCWAVWEAFCDSLAESKKKTGTSPTTSPPTAAPASSPAIGTSSSA